MANDFVDRMTAAVSFPVFQRAVLWTSALFALVMGALAAWWAGRAPARGRWIGAWAALLAAALAAWWLLTVANIELIHFPQYAVLAVLLFAGGLHPTWALIGATSLGAIDEVYQHFVLYADRQEAYLDFNDMVLNCIGAAGGLLLALAARAARHRPWGSAVVRPT
jgi:hypothetical protein